MNDQLMRELLHEVADDADPGDRLDAIRAATTPSRRTGRGWWVAGGAGLLVASVVTAFALTTGGVPSSEPDPAAPVPTTLPTTIPTDGPPDSNVVAVYFVGDTSGGSRLFREFRSRPDVGSTRVDALNASVQGNSLDPDYRSAWPAGVSVHDLERTTDGISFSLSGATRERPPGVSEGDARLAIEQLVRTAQAPYGMGKLPVRVLLDGEESDKVLGVPTAVPLTGSPDVKVLAPVWLSDPNEGQVFRADATVWASGRAVSADDKVTVRVQRWEGTAVAMGPATFTLNETSGPPGSFSLGLESDDLQPGEYDVIATVLNADGTYDTDTRRITIVD